MRQKRSSRESVNAKIQKKERKAVRQKRSREERESVNTKYKRMNERQSDKSEIQKREC